MATTTISDEEYNSPLRQQGNDLSVEENINETTD